MRGQNMEEQIQKVTEEQSRPTTVYEKILASVILLLGCAILLGVLALCIFIPTAPETAQGKFSARHAIYGTLLGIGALGLGGYAWKNPAYWDRPFGKFLKVLIPLLIFLFIFVIFVNR